jgi:hypothetical protein
LWSIQSGGFARTKQQLSNVAWRLRSLPIPAINHR